MKNNEEQKNAPQHSINVDHQTIFEGDNLDILRGFNSECVDLIYLDPPFNSKANYAAPIGSQAAGAAFKDTWGLDDIKLAWHGIIKHDYPALYAFLQAVRLVHSDSMMSYLMYMAVRIMELRRILKPSGSIYLHCDPTASHYLKLLMDCLFGKTYFRNEIIWCYRGGGVPKHDFAKKHDVIFRYSSATPPTFNVDAVRISYSESVRHSRESRYDKSYQGTTIYAGYKPNVLGKHPEDWWEIQPLMPSDKKERTGYPTQKPMALLSRIIKASSHKGDMVLDPFCGCATTCIAAEKLDRHWIGIDISPKAGELVQDRLRKEVGFFFHGVCRTDIPCRTDIGKMIPYNALPNKKSLYGEQGGYCNGCEHHFQMQHLTVDHIIPRAHGGTDHISNLQLLCGNCNSIKGHRTQEELIRALTDKGYVKRKYAA